MHSRIKVTLAIVAYMLFMVGPADARRVRRSRAALPDEISTGIGFAADLSRATPGGFKWFNDYSHHLGGPTWINFQLNVTSGGGRDCYYRDGYRYCRGHFGGSALELGVGAKFKWWVRRVPIQLHAKLGPAVELVWYDGRYGGYDGTAVAVRGGLGARYFFLPFLGAGVELAAAVGPMFTDYGTEVFSTIDLNFGVEFRF